MRTGASLLQVLASFLLGSTSPPACAQDGLVIQQFQRDAEGFNTLTFRTGKPDPVVLLGGTDPARLTEPLATNPPAAGEGAFRVPPVEGPARFFQLWQPAATGSGLEGLPRLAVGAAFTIAVRGDGSLWSWGSNFRGALGNGLTTNTDLPAPIPAAGPWRTMASGFNHTLALRADGTLWGWGENRYGEATGDAIGPVPTPTAIAPEARWRWIAAGTWFSLAVRDDGSLWAWGQNTSGQLGLGHRSDTNRPVQVGTARDWVRVAAGPSYSIGIRQDGSLWQWGEPYWGAPTSAPAQFAAGTGWKEVAAGATHAIGVRTNGTLWSWGENLQGKLGLGTNRPPVPGRPTQVGSDSDWRGVGAAATHSLALKSDGTVWAWGANPSGALALGESILQTNRPTLVKGLGPVREVALGRDHGIALLEDGSLSGWGNNASGEVGDGTRTRRFEPVPVASGAVWGP